MVNGRSPNGECEHEAVGLLYSMLYNIFVVASSVS
jgi:hypothetical protein